MRISSLLILLSLILFITCGEDDNPFSIDPEDLLGNWILVKQKATVKQNGKVIQEATQTYTIKTSFYLFVFTEDSMTWYSHFDDEIDSISYPYTASEGKLYISGAEYADFRIEGRTLIISISQEVDSLTYYSKLSFNKYYDEVPPNEWLPIEDIPNNATTIQTNGTPLNGTLGSGGVDWYSFNATSGNTYVIETTGDLDSYLRLYEVIGSDEMELIASDDDDGDGWNAKITWTCSSSGTYYFSVRETFDEEAGDYGVSVTSSRVDSE